MIDRIYCQVLPTSEGHTAILVREATGVLKLVLLLNFPLLMPVWKIWPALAAGCSVSVKSFRGGYSASSTSGFRSLQGRRWNIAGQGRAGQQSRSLNGVAVMRAIEHEVFSGCVQNGFGTLRGTPTGSSAA